MRNFLAVLLLGIPLMAQAGSLTVDGVKNTFALGSWGTLEKTAASQTLTPGTYVVRIKQGNFSFWGKGIRAEPFVLIWMHGGSFINKATGVSTSATWSALNGVDDTLTVQVVKTTTLYGLFIDSNNRDNSGQVTLSILKE